MLLGVGTFEAAGPGVEAGCKSSHLRHVRWLLIVCIASIHGSALLADQTLSVSFAWEVESQNHRRLCAKHGLLYAEPIAGLPGEALPTVKQWSLKASSSLQISLSPNWSWRLYVLSSHCWAPTTTLEKGNLPEALELWLWPSGSVHGKVFTERDKDHWPAELRLRIQTVEGNEISTELGCPISLIEPGEWLWECTLPATRLDLRLYLQGYAPGYLWDVEVPSGNNLALGAVALERGGSVGGWVTHSSEDSSVDEIEIELVPELPEAAGVPSTERRLQVQSLSVLASPEGRFQLDDIPGGSYALLAKGPRTYSPVRIAPIVIEPGEEIVIESPIFVGGLGRLEVLLQPQVDPYSKPWDVVLKRQLPLSSYLRTVAGKRPVSAEGHWIEDEVEAGSYFLEIYDSRGSKYLRHELTIEEDTPLLELTLPVVRVVGSLSKGGEPLSSELLFLGPNGEHVQLVADAAGRFEGCLPAGGDWRVKIVAADGRSKLFLGSRYVTVPEGDDFAFVEIDLPDTRIHGRIVDESGNAVKRSLITVFEGSTPRTQVYGKPTGEFEIVGLQPGLKQIRVEASQDRSSQTISYDLKEDRVQEPIEVVVHPLITLRGKVWASGRPLPGALIRYLVPDHVGGGVRETITDPGGGFSIRVPRSKSIVEVDLGVVSLGFPRKILRARLQPNDEMNVSVVLPALGGQLRIGLQASRFIFRGDVKFPLWALLAPPDRGDLRGFDPLAGTITFEAEAGEYVVCPTERRTKDCASGFLAPGGALVLSAQSTGTSSTGL